MFDEDVNNYHKLRSYSFLFFWANLMQFEVILKLTRAILANQDGPIGLYKVG